MKIFIHGGRIIDPANGRDEISDILLMDGEINAIDFVALIEYAREQNINVTAEAVPCLFMRRGSMSLLSGAAEEWLYEFVTAAISSGLRNHSEHISEVVCEELMEQGWIDRTSGNDGDYAWHGKVKLDADFSKQLPVSLNIYGILRMFIADNHEKAKES